VLVTYDEEYGGKPTGKLLKYSGFVVEFEKSNHGNLYTVVFPADYTFQKGVAFRSRVNSKTKEEYQVLVETGRCTPSGSVAMVAPLTLLLLLICSVFTT
jgi:hypothetical protein